MATKIDENQQYRQHLVAAGYTVTVNRHTEKSRAKATWGQRRASYTVTLGWPDGRTTRHNAPDSLAAAYRAACLATPLGLPTVTAPLLAAAPAAGDAPLRKKGTPNTDAVAPQPSLFE